MCLKREAEKTFHPTGGGTQAWENRDMSYQEGNRNRAKIGRGGKNQMGTTSNLWS